MDTRDHSKEEIEEELKWAKEVEAIHEQEIALHMDFVPDRFERLTEMNPRVLKEHIQRLEHDLEDLRKNRVKEDGFEEIDRQIN